MRKNEQGLTYCRANKHPIPKTPRTSDKWCVCGYHNRGQNHCEGEHHQKREQDAT